MPEVVEAIVILVDPAADQAVRHLEGMIRQVTTAGHGDDASPLHDLLDRLRAVQAG